MPLLLAEKPEAIPEALSLERFTGTVNNQTDASLVLLYSNVCQVWDKSPAFEVPRGTQVVFGSSGDFANPACGTVSYQYKGTRVPGAPAFTLHYTIPSLGPNQIVVTSDPGLRVVIEGDRSGWDVYLTFVVTVG